MTHLQRPTAPTMSTPEETATAFAAALTAAVQASLASLTSQNQDGSLPTKPPNFSMVQYKSSESTSVEDYFTRFDWALQLSKVPSDLHAN